MVASVKWIRDNDLPNPLEKLGMGMGFFRRFSDSFWKATGMELDLVYTDGEPWDSVAHRVRGSYCRELALNPANSELCRMCFLAACQKARADDGFHTVKCHADQSFSVRSFGEVEGARLLLLTGRVEESDHIRIAADITREGSASRYNKSPEGYQAALDLLDASLPYLRLRLQMDLLMAARELPPLVRRACRYVDEHFRENISVAGVAGALGVSEDYLSHSFSKHTGNPLGRYIAGVRTGHSMCLLREGNHGIAEIAFESGFQSLSQFNRTFKSLQGVSPGEFRRTERAGSGE